MSELRTALEAIKSAGLDWEVKSEPIYVKDGVKGFEDAGYVDVPRRSAIVRQDTRRVLGIATPRYVPVQNVEAFTFADSIVGPNQAIYEEALSLSGGEKVCLKLRLKGDITIDRNKDDVIARYLILTNWHDGRHSLRAVIAPLRLICTNGLTAIGEAESSINIRHTGVISAKVSEAQRVLGLTVKYYDELSYVYNALANKDVTQVEVKSFLEKLIPDTKDGKTTTRTTNVRAEIETLYRTGKGNDLPGIKGTAWALVNGVTDYVSHDRTARGDTKEQKDSNRLESSWFGTGAALNTRALHLVKELAQVK